MNIIDVNPPAAQNKRNIVCVSRGPNPLMSEISKRFSMRWEQFSHEETASVQMRIDVLRQRMQSVLPDLIICDNTLSAAAKLLHIPIINAYDCLSSAQDCFTPEEIRTHLGATVEHIRQSGCTPIVLEYNLGDHMPSPLPDTLKVVREKASMKGLTGLRGGAEYAYLVSSALQIGVLAEYVENMNVAKVMLRLQKINVDDKTKFVCLVDHHCCVNPKAISQLEALNASIILICPCCIDRQPESAYQEFRDKKIPAFPLENLQPNNGIINQVIAAIQEKLDLINNTNA